MSMMALPQALPRMVRLALLLTFSSAFALVSAQTIEVKLIDGRNGHPIANTCVNVWVGRQQKDALAIPTDKDGVARLQLTDVDADINTQNRWKQCGEFGVINPVVRFENSVTINAGYVLCQPQGTDYSWLALKNFPTKEILAEGVVSPNACGKHTASPVPGQVIVFVRPLSFWEKLKQ
ncbi:MAG TPA: hypothetical protein VGH51_22110 [Candidatus Angelobacter sp.]